MSRLNRLLLAALLLVASGAWAASPAYRQPMDAMKKLVDAPLPPRVQVSPDDRYAAFMERSVVRSLADLAAEEVRLAGRRIRPATFAPSRATPYSAIKVVSLDDGTYRNIPLPEGRILSASWSPNGRWLAFVAEETDGLKLWTFDAKTGETRRVADRSINGVIGGYFTWERGGDAVLTKFAVNAGKTYLSESELPAGPAVQETRATRAAVRTYQDLLSDERDSAYFEFLAESQIARVDLTDGKITELNRPGLYWSIARSPSGEYILAEQIERPFSYIVPYSRFPLRSEVWTTDGERVATVAELPLAEDVPQGFDSVRLGRRDIEWRADLPATLVWMEAQDEGTMKTETDVHDVAFALDAPFDGEPTELYRFALRGSAFQWGNASTALAIEYRFADRKLQIWKFSPDGSSGPVLWQERSYNDEYKDPGSPISELSAFDTYVIRVNDDGSVLLEGEGASPRGYEPFIDRYDFDSGEGERLWRSKPPYFERPFEILGETGSRLLFTRESPTENPNFFIADFADNSERQLTDFPHPTPELRDVSKELIKYQRADGVELSGTLYLPSGYDPDRDGAIPVLMWAYPLEYKDPKVAGQLRESPYQFNRIGFWGPLPHLAQGIAVFDDPKMPIIGADDALPNDSFRGQLVAGAKAAVDVLVDRGIADPGRIAIAGHSYGAFMVANLLAHSDLFAAGIARSGAYNRSLTPFGFQGEERDFWEGQDVYATMSPFFHAEKINEPILFIHGAADNNSGTFPMQSERMFAAVKGLGGTARLVMLPYESHGYRARESILHVLWEQSEWLNAHIMPQ